ncbi:MAG: TRAP transporter large permease subunit, partial [Spirochaetota bacterium]
MVGAILFGLFGILALIGVPVGISLGLSTVVAIWTLPGLNLDFFVRGLVVGLDSFPLIAVLFFTVAGNIMGRGGISSRLLGIADMFFGRMTGGLGMVSIVACMMFAAISGTGSATVAAIGSIMIPAMVKKGYDRNFAGSLVASAGTIGAIIPPSVAMIIYAIASGVSVTSMFIGGILPGILVGVFLILYCYLYSRKHHYGGAVENEYVSEKTENIFHTLWALSVPVMILGGIYSGVFTPTEASGVAVVYGTFIGIFIYKEIRWKDLAPIFLESTLLVSCVL